MFCESSFILCSVYYKISCVRSYIWCTVYKASIFRQYSCRLVSPGSVFSVPLSPTITQARFALVTLTLILLVSARKPMSLVSLDLTKLRMMTSFSRPWNPSTVLKQKYYIKYTTMTMYTATAMAVDTGYGKRYGRGSRLLKLPENHQVL